MKLAYSYRLRSGRLSRSIGQKALVLVAGKRLIRGRGRFTIEAPFRLPTSLKAPKLRRLRALDVLSKALGLMHAGDSLKVRDGSEQIVLAVAAVPTLDPRRAAIVRFARWGCAHEPEIHYSQARPIDFAFRNLPWSADCSGSTIAYAKAAGCADPSGHAYSGAGDTDTILAHLKRKPSLRSAEVGDVILWAIGSDGKHVAIVVKRGRNPLLASHGFEGGPILIRFTDENRYHAGETAHVLDLLSG